jgi:Glycosyl hydrolase catalytic core
MRKILLLSLCATLWFTSKGQLTIYSAFNSQGVSGTCVIRTIYKSGSIPNGLNNSIKSISLSQGFMATLAENEDGTGERFTYMATQSAINVNLAFVLQNKVSFIRVLKLPGTAVKKKGAGFTMDADEIAANVTWFYDWGFRDTSVPSREYVPMAWGKSSAIALRIDTVTNKDSLTHYLAFNEPNSSGQANMFVNQAIPYRTWVDSFAT